MLRDTAAVILNYACLPQVEQCAASLLAGGLAPQDLILVDNDSPDGSGAELPRLFPSSRIILSPENLGYAGGNNLGLARAMDQGYAFIYVSNPDTQVLPDTLAALHAAAAEDAGTGVLGSVTLRSSTGRLLYRSLRLEPARGLAVTFVGEGEPLEGIGNAPALLGTDFAGGSSLLIRTEALRQTGLFDGRFFMYWEEVELCARMRGAGWRVAVAGRAVVRRHDESVVSPLSLYYTTRNGYLYKQATGSPASSFRILARQAATLARLLQRGHRRKLALARAFMLALFDAVRGRWGRSRHPL